LGKKGRKVKNFQTKGDQSKRRAYGRGRRRKKVPGKKTTISRLSEKKRKAESGKGLFLRGKKGT